MSATTLEVNKAIAYRYLDELWNKKNLDIIDEVFAPEFIGNLTSPSKGPEGVRRNAIAFHEAFPDSHTTFDDLFGEEDRIAIRWTTTATHLGPLFGIPPTGKKVELKGITIEQFKDGRITELWAEIDVHGLLKQLRS